MNTISLKILTIKALLLLCTVNNAPAQEQVFALPNQQIELMEASVNTKQAQIGPFIINGILYFSSPANPEHEEFNHLSFFDIYSTGMHKSIAGEKAMPAREAFSSDFHDGPASYCEATGELFITQSNYENAITKKGIVKKTKVRLKIVIYHRVNGKWEIKEDFLYNNPRYSVGHPAINASGDSLFFVSNQPGGYGKSDIYLSRKVNGQWKEPLNLGSGINTRKSEITPFIDKNGTLYFASKGHKAGNNFNIYASLPRNRGFNTPVQLAKPVNSRSNDYGLTIHPNGNIAYFVSDRKRRNDNIFIALKNGYQPVYTNADSAQIEIDDILRKCNLHKSQLLENLKSNNFISNNIKFDTKIELINKEEIPDLKITFSYSLTGDTLVPGNNTYRFSTYNTADSRAVETLLRIIQSSIDNYMDALILPGKKINITLYGQPDGLPIFSNTKYEGEFGDSIHAQYACLQQSYNTIISKNTALTDNTLAYLRTYGIRYYIENELKTLKRTHNYFKHKTIPREQSYNNAELTKIELIIENAFSNF